MARIEQVGLGILLSLGIALLAVRSAFAQSSSAVNPAPPMPAITNSPLLPPSAENGTVNFSFLPCDRAKGHVFSDGLIHYSISSGSDSWSLNQNVAWRSSDPTALRRSFTVPPGAYSYEVTAMEGHDSNDPSYIYCSQYYYVVVLPGSEQRISETMYQGLADPIPNVYIYGLAPPSYDISVIRYPSNPKCGTSLSGLPGTKLTVKRDNVGYYASDSFLTHEHEKDAVFGVRVAPKGAAHSRTYRVLADYPASIVSIVPTSARLDVGPMTPERSARSSDDTLLCLSGANR